MPSSRDSLLDDRPPGWPAWCVSLVIHLGLMAMAICWIKPPTVQGAAEQPTRNVGIVLKHMTDDGPRFEDEDEKTEDDNQPIESESSNTNTDSNALAENPLLAALPTPEEFPSSAAALPRISTFGPAAAPTPNKIADAAHQMTTGGSPSRRIGSKTTVSIFGISGTGTRFVYVFDRSISMAGPPLRAAKQQLIASLDALDTVHQFQIIFFHHEPLSWDITRGQKRIAFATDANKKNAKKFINNVTAAGGTYRHTALKLALRLQPDVIFFLTDTDDPMVQADLQEAISRAQRDAIAINTIEYGTGNVTAHENFLTQLAQQTGGRYVYVDTNKLGRRKRKEE